MDDFDDDGFDDLNIAILQELESKAILSLQSQGAFQNPFQQRPQPSLRGDAPNAGGHDDTVEVIQIEDDVDQTDAEVLRELARMPAQHSMTGRLGAAAALPPLPLPAYSQKNLVDVPLPATTSKNDARHSINTMTVNTRPDGAYYGGTQWQEPGTRGFPQANTMAAPPRPAGSQSLGSVANAHANLHPDSTSIAALQARLRTLETDLYTARGRASMMHDKYETEKRKHEAELARIQKQKDEEVEKQRQRAEAAAAAYRSTATELEFIKQDLRDEVEKGKKGRRTDRVDAPSTPRKNTAVRSNWDVADGFEDVDLLPSPSKGFGRRLKDAGNGALTPAGERTPTKTKRRRPITDSPSMPLETLAVGTEQEPPNGSLGSGALAVASNALSDGRGSTEEAPFLFLQDVLNHQAHPDEPATVELFSRYSFPSNPKQTLAFLLLQRIPKLEGRQGTTRLMLDFCQLVLGIWSQCLREKYYAPVRPLVSLVSYILTHDLRGVAPHILESLLPLAQMTIYLVAEPAFNNPTGILATHPDYAVRQLACDIDTGAIISLLRLVALGCLGQSRADKPASEQQLSQASDRGLSTTAQAWFWSLVHFEFVLLMLSSKQPPEAFFGMLSLLQTSALPDSIGPITNDPNKDASVVAALIIDRISHHIEEPPKWAGLSKYTEWDVRLSAFGVLDCFAQSPFGKLSLAASHCALPRLVDVFFTAYEELRSRDLLYEPLRPSVGRPSFTETHMRAYGLGGPDLTTSAELGLCKTTPNAASAEDIYSGGVATDQDSTPLVLLYVSSVICLLHSIVTDPFTAKVADMPAKLAEKRGGTQSFYLLTMARLGFRADPAFTVGLGEEIYQFALELFRQAATPDEAKDYAAWAQQGNTNWEEGDSHTAAAIVGRQSDQPENMVFV